MLVNVPRDLDVSLPLGSYMDQPMDWFSPRWRCGASVPLVSPPTSSPGWTTRPITSPTPGHATLHHKTLGKLVRPCRNHVQEVQTPATFWARNKNQFVNPITPSSHCNRVFELIGARYFVAARDLVPIQSGRVFLWMATSWIVSYILHVFS